MFSTFRIYFVEIVAIKTQYNFGFWNTQIRSIKRTLTIVKVFTGFINLPENVNII